MLGYEPSRPKLWKAIIAAAIVVFPFSYVIDVAVTHHQPRWLYFLIATGVTLVIGLQAYARYGAMLYKNSSTVWWRGLSRAALSLLPDRSKPGD